jgi:1-acyl-sn-glycerol-3-phosphate acyltransferase
MTERTLVWRYLQVLGRVLCTVLFDLKVYGRENVPKTGGALLVANHQSYLDPVLVACQLHRPVSFLAKSELFKNPFFGWFIRQLHAFPVRQGEGDVGAVREAIRRLDEGYILNVYPEGGRTLTGEMMPLEKGVALVVRKAKVPVIPVGIQGSFDAWPAHRTVFRPHPVRVIYGKPIYLEGKKADQILRELDEAIRALIAELRAM